MVRIAGGPPDAHPARDGRDGAHRLGRGAVGGVALFDQCVSQWNFAQTAK